MITRIVSSQGLIYEVGTLVFANDSQTAHVKEIEYQYGETAMGDRNAYAVILDDGVTTIDVYEPTEVWRTKDAPLPPESSSPTTKDEYIPF